MKIAFTSCFDVIRDESQVAWLAMAKRQPDHVVLLGDNIYMDYAWGHKYGLRKPGKLSLAEFASTMHSYFAKQWAVPSFQVAIAAPAVHAIWDDHDFAWDNSRGGEYVFDDDRYVPPEYRRVSRLLFEQYRQALVDKPESYPANPCPTGEVSQDLGGIQTHLDLRPDLRLHLLDGRSFREVPGPISSLLGKIQREALGLALLPAPAINLIASGTTLSDWRLFRPDHLWLKSQCDEFNILVLSGDIHEPVLNLEKLPYEATASAMAQPQGMLENFSKRSEVFGLVEVSAEDVRVDIFHQGQTVLSGTLARATWTPR